MTRLVDRILEKRLRESSRHTLLLGPRQVGKSTLVRGLAPERYLNLRDERAYLRFSKDPGLLFRELDAARPGLVVVDEIQRVPRLLNSLQTRIDDPQNEHRFVLTGSSARKLKRGGANLLPGRLILEQLAPLSALELDELGGVDLDRALAVGMLPGIYLDRDFGAEILESYVDIYLREEIQAEALVRNIGDYARFFDTFAAVSGHWLNYSKLADDAEVSKETIRRYIVLLEDTLVAYRLPAWRGSDHTSRKTQQRDKVFLCDVGLRNAALQLHRAIPSPDQRGLLFEHWFVQQVFALKHGYRKPWQLKTFRTRSGSEVDLILELPDALDAIEVKATQKPTRKHFRGIQSFLHQEPKKPVRRRWLVCRAERRQRFDGLGEAVPYLDAIRELAED